MKSISIQRNNQMLRDYYSAFYENHLGAKILKK